MADNQIRRLLECSVCYEEMRDPRILPCHHSFCLECLRDLRDTGINRPRCPSCNAPIFLGNLEQLPRDFRTNSLIDSISNRNNATRPLVQDTGGRSAYRDHDPRHLERPGSWTGVLQRGWKVPAAIVCLIAVCAGIYQWNKGIQCPGLSPNIKHIHVDIRSRDIGGTARISCDEGYKWTGSHIVECDADGKWKGRGGTCKDVRQCAAVSDDDRRDCGYPGITKEECVMEKSCCFDESIPDIANCYFGNACGVSQHKRRDCGHPGITEDACVRGGVCCFDDSNPNIANCYFNGSVPTKITKPAECPTSDRNTGIPCAEDDDPDITVEKCYALGCCYDPTVNHCFSLHARCGYFSTGFKKCHVDIGNRYVGDTAMIYCDEGYKYTGSAIWVCQPDGTWNGESGSFELIQCPELSPPEHGEVYMSGYDIKDTAEVVCDDGYEYTGTDIWVCGLDGHWIGSKGICKGP